jgi:hypothetical protein
MAVPVERQIGEQQRDLLAPEALRELDAVDLHGQPSAKLNPGSVAAGPAAGNVLETY